MPPLPDAPNSMAAAIMVEWKRLLMAVSLMPVMPASLPPMAQVGDLELGRA
jgi:hypothetical protein